MASWSISPRRINLAPGVSAEVLVEVEDVGAYRVHIAPGVNWTCPEGVRIQPVGGPSRIAPKRTGASKHLGETTEAVLNPSDTLATVLAVCRPPLGVGR